MGDRADSTESGAYQPERAAEQTAQQFPLPRHLGRDTPQNRSFLECRTGRESNRP